MYDITKLFYRIGDLLIKVQFSCRILIPGIFRVFDAIIGCIFKELNSSMDFDEPV